MERARADAAPTASAGVDALQPREGTEALGQAMRSCSSWGSPPRRATRGARHGQGERGSAGRSNDFETFVETFESIAFRGFTAAGYSPPRPPWAISTASYCRIAGASGYLGVSAPRAKPQDLRANCLFPGSGDAPELACEASALPLSYAPYAPDSIGSARSWPAPGSRSRNV
jgi:hypothetical protein